MCPESHGWKKSCADARLSVSDDAADPGEGFGLEAEAGARTADGQFPHLARGEAEAV